VAGLVALFSVAFAMVVVIRSDDEMGSAFALIGPSQVGTRHRALPGMDKSPAVMPGGCSTTNGPSLRLADCSTYVVVNFPVTMPPPRGVPYPETSSLDLGFPASFVVAMRTQIKPC